MYVSNLANKYQVFLWDLILTIYKIFTTLQYQMVNQLQPCYDLATLSQGCYNFVISIWVLCETLGTVT